MPVSNGSTAHARLLHRDRRITAIRSAIEPVVQADAQVILPGGDTAGIPIEGHILRHAGIPGGQDGWEED